MPIPRNGLEQHYGVEADEYFENHERETKNLTARDLVTQAEALIGGKGRLPERSAAMVLWGNRTYNEVDLRVDLHERAIEELRRIYVDYKPSIAYYEQRARSPRNAIPAMEFADMLKKQQAKETT